MCSVASGAKPLYVCVSKMLCKSELRSWEFQHSRVADVSFRSMMWSRV
jgi:hypothetical protein